MQYVCSNCGVATELSEREVRDLEKKAGLFQKRLQCPSCRAFVAIPDARLPLKSAQSGYQIGARIELDGARELYEAEHIESHACVEIQTFNQPVIGEGDPAREFLEAMKRYLAIRHPLLTRVLDAGKFAEGTFFAAWPRNFGISMDRRLKQSGALDLKQAVHLITLIGKFEEWLWLEHHLLYGTISPRRIIVAPDNSILVSNPILSPLPGDQLPPFPANTLGMPGFMSPEMVQGGRILDSRSDMYSLAATFFALLTGTAPFTGLNSQEVQAIHATGDIPNPHAFKPSIPVAAVDFLRTAMAPDPASRPQNWAIFHQMLAQLVADPIAPQATPPSRPAVVSTQAPLPAPVMAPSRPGSFWATPPPAATPTAPVTRSDPPRTRPAPSSAAPAPATTTKKTVFVPASTFSPQPMPQRRKASSSAVFISITVLGFLALGSIVIFSALHPSPPPRPESPKPKPAFVSEVVPPGTAMALPPPEAQPPAAAPERLPKAELSPFDALYAATQTHLKTNPTDYELLLTNYNTLVAMTETVKPAWHFKMLEERRNIEMLRSFALERAVTEIRQRNSEFISSTSYREGIAWLTNYSGPLVKDTAELRGHLASNLTKLAQTTWNDAKDQQLEAKATSEAKAAEKLTLFNEALVKAVLDANLDQARTLITNADFQQDLGLPLSEREAMLAQITRLANLQEIILDRYRTLTGTTIRLVLVNETMNGTVVSVENQRIKFRSMGADGESLTMEVPLENVGTQEIIQRLADAPVPDRALLQGYFAWRRNNLKLASTFFASTTNTPVGRALSAHAQLEQDQLREMEALSALHALEKMAGVTAHDQAPAVMADQIDETSFTEAQCAEIRTAHHRFTRQYGASDVARKAGPILTSIAAVSGISRKLSLPTLKNMIEPLRAMKAGNKPLLFSYRLDGNSVYLDLSENKALPSLTTLKSLPFKELVLRKCGINRVPQLEGFRISRLDLSDSDVTDLSGLRNAEIDELIISGTSVSDLRALKSLPLRVFIAENCQALSDLSGLTTSNLTKIVLAGSGVSDLAPLAGAPLVSADFSRCTLINDLKAIAKCPLEELNLSGCSRVAMIYSLRDIPLKTLDIGGTAVSDLTPLASMPIETLNLANARNITDLSPLTQNNHIQELTLPSKTANAGCLRQSPSITAIGYPTPISAELFWRRTP